MLWWYISLMNNNLLKRKKHQPKREKNCIERRTYAESTQHKRAVRINRENIKRKKKEINCPSEMIWLLLLLLLCCCFFFLLLLCVYAKKTITQLIQISRRTFSFNTQISIYTYGHSLFFFVFVFLLDWEIQNTNNNHHNNKKSYLPWTD